MNKIALTIIISLILTIIIVSIVNVGTSLFLDEPEYEDYCDEIQRAVVLEGDEDFPAEVELDEACYEEFRDAREPYNQKKFYIFAGIGFVLLICGLIFKELLLQITGLAAGGILVFEGIVTNLEDKLIVFIALLAILIIFGIIAYRVIKSKK